MTHNRIVAACAISALIAGIARLQAEDAGRPFTLIVMDPLAAPLSCPCVEGYAQRRYDVLARHLESHSGTKVKLVFAESLQLALKKTNGRADVIIGKDSVVRADAKAANIKVSPLGHLTDKQGSTTQTGLIVVNRDDPAKCVKDLDGYRIIFGPTEASEKHAAAMQLLTEAGVAIPQKLTIDTACSDGACKVIDVGPKSKTAAVISSYAQPLLEGCGTIKKGDLRVVGQTTAVPFITAFASESLPVAQRDKVSEALEAIATMPKILVALESLIGFLPADFNRDRGSLLEDIDRSSSAWPGWRGPDRDGLVPHLPSSLSPEPKILWQLPLARSGLGGIAATRRFVVFGDRDIDDFHDVFRCLDANSGEQIWQVERLAIAALDYGNSPRTTPLIANDRVYCLGAHGDLLCLNLTDGAVIWERNLREHFGSPGELPWGYCGSPLLVGNNLIVNPGAKDASIAALNAHTGTVEWKSPGSPPSFGSLHMMIVSGRQQIIGHDKTSLGGWDPLSGRRLWTVTPNIKGDFNVPTPVTHNGHLLVTTENNGARLFQFGADGLINSEPVATNAKLRPDMSSGVVVNHRFYCVKQFLYCLDLMREARKPIRADARKRSVVASSRRAQDGKKASQETLNDDLKERWRLRDSALSDYAAIIASDDRILVVGNGTLLLLKADGSKDIIARQQVFDEDLPIYSHPALVDNRLYIRGETMLLALRL